MRLLALSVMAAAGSAAVLPSSSACIPCSCSSVETVTVLGPTVTVTLLPSMASSSSAITTTVNGTLTYTNVVTVLPSSSASEASSYFVVTNSSTSWLSSAPTDSTYVIGTTTIFVAPTPATSSSLTGGAVPTSNGTDSTIHLTSVITLTASVVETITAPTPYGTGVSHGTGLPYGIGVGPSGSGWNSTSSPSSTEGSGVFGTVSGSGSITSSVPSASASSVSPILSTGVYPSAPYGSPFTTSSSSSSAPSSSANATSSSASSSTQGSGVFGNATSSAIPSLSTGYIPTAPYGSPAVSSSSSALSSTEGSSMFGNATSSALPSLSTGYYPTAPYGSPVIGSTSSVLSFTQGSGVFGNATSTSSSVLPSDTCTEEGASSTVASALPVSTSSSVPSVTPTPYYPNATSSIAASPSATNNGTAATPKPTACGESGNFTLTWDDEPAFTPDQPNVDPWAPVFNPYHHMFFSNGYAYVPAGADNEPFAAISRPELAIFLPNATDSDVGSPNAAGVNAGEIGAGPRVSLSAYWFDVFGVFIGCDNSGPGDCELLTSGWQWDEEAQIEVITVQRKDYLKPCAAGMLNCQLTEIVYDDYFRNLSGIQFQAKVNNASSIFLLDNLSMGWSNNSCEAGLTRQSSH